MRWRTFNELKNIRDLITDNFQFEKIESGEIERLNPKEFESAYLSPNQFLYIYNLRDGIYEYVSHNYENILLNPDRVMTLSFLLNNMHPDDRFIVVDKFKEALLKLAGKKNLIPMEIEFCINFRMKNINDEYIWFLKETCLFKNDNEGNPLYIASRFTISMYNKTNIIQKYYKTLKDPTKRLIEYYNPGKDNIHFTSHEIMVLKLIVKGYKSCEILKELKISKDTLKKHREHLLEKTNTHTMPALISYVLMNGLLIGIL